MRKLLGLCLFLPLLGIGQSKNVMSSVRVFAKVDKISEFEKALAAHAQKYHTGDWKWRVFEIQSGPDANGYQIVEGPVSWDQLDGRGDLGAEHTNDWNKNVAIYMSDRGSSTYSVYEDTLSSVALTDYSDKISITHWVQKVGWGGKLRELISKMKAVWKVDGETVAVYTSSASGPGQYMLVTRYKQGLKERNASFRKPFKESYEGVYGANSFEGFLDVLRQYVAEQWSELLFLRKDLGSK